MSEKDQDKKVTESKSEVSEVVADTTVVAVDDTTTPVTAATEVGTPVVAKSGSSMKSYLLAVLALGIIGGLLLYGLERQGRIDTGIFSFVEKYQTVASVNGVKISRDRYEQNLTQLTQSATAQGVDINDPEVQAEISTQAIDVLINGELLLQEADRLNIVAEDEEVDARYNDLVEQLGGEDELLARLSEVGVNRATLMDDIRDEIRVEKLLEVAINRDDIVVSDEEVREVYDEAAAMMPEVPSFEEARPTIEMQLSFTKEQELLREYVEGLRENADVRVKI